MKKLCIWETTSVVGLGDEIQIYTVSSLLGSFLLGKDFRPSYFKSTPKLVFEIPWDLFCQIESTLCILPKVYQLQTVRTQETNNAVSAPQILQSTSNLTKPKPDYFLKMLQDFPAWGFLWYMNLCSTSAIISWFYFTSKCMSVIYQQENCPLSPPTLPPPVIGV